MALWHVTARSPSRLRLWRTGPSAFRVVEPGEPADLLTNYDYVLFDQRYEGALRSTGAQLQLTPVVVTDQVRQRQWHHYLEARILPEISAEDIRHGSSFERLICRLSVENEVFVSESLKELLQRVQGQRLSFSPGLTRFA